MKTFGPSVFGALCAGFLALSGLASAQSLESFNTLRQFEQDHPFAGVYQPVERISRVYGRAFSHGVNPDASAEAFLHTYAPMFGVRTSDLIPEAWDERGTHHQGAVYEPATDSYKFTVLRYAQMRGGIPVFRGQLKLLVRNEAGFPLVLASADLRDIGAFDPALAGAARGDGLQRGQQTASRILGRTTQFEAAEQVIWAGVDEQIEQPRLAFSFIAENGDPSDPVNGYQRILYIVDAATGAVLYEENQVLHTDIVGTVDHVVTTGIGADICGSTTTVGMPYARVQVAGGSPFYADENGNFTITHGGSSPVTVQSPMRGRWFQVLDANNGPRNGATAPPPLTQQVTPPGPANFTHNAGNPNELQRANANTYLHANVVRDYALAFNPQYPTIWNQTNFSIYTNINQNCNAFYNGNSINFYTAGGGCSNTAASTIIYHEYGHHLVNTAGSGQGAYGEGMSDCVAVLITDSPLLGLGFSNNCNNPLRNADNNCQYQTSGCSSCGSAVHSCGRLISGCVWSTRNELLATHPSTYRDIISTLTINSILLHTGTAINPSITIDFLTIDDDDSDILNGTPHYAQINAGFSAHNMAAPPLSLLSFEYPDGRPEFISPGGGAAFTVRVHPIAGQPQPGTGMLHVDSGSGFTAYPMLEVDNNLYEAVFPSNLTCAAVVRYFVSVETTASQEVRHPQNAPASWFEAFVGTSFNVVFHDDFETNQGWTVSGNATDGHWERAIPIPWNVCNRGNPPGDADGSGHAYVTDNSPAGGCNSDVDNGSTILTSPLINALGAGDAFISYWRWYDNSRGANPGIDVFTVQVSNNNGGSWTNVEVVGPSGPETTGGWVFKQFRIADFVTPTSQMRFRFIASDLGQQSVVEAAVDGVSVYLLQCDPVTILTEASAFFGSVQAGGLNELLESDDQHMRLRSQFGFTALEPNLLELRVVAVTDDPNAALLDLGVESRINNPSGTGTFRLRNQQTGVYTIINQHSISSTESLVTVDDIPSDEYIHGNGTIEMSVRHVVLATFTALGFDSFFDQVTIRAKN